MVNEAQIKLNVITITEDQLRRIVREEVEKALPKTYTPYIPDPYPYKYPYNPALPGITYSTNKIDA